MDAEQEPVRDLVLLTLERGQQRLADAAAQLHEYERLAAIAAKAVEQARQAKAEAMGGAEGGAEGSAEGGAEGSAEGGAVGAVARVAQSAADEALGRLRGLLKTALTPLHHPTIERLAAEYSIAEPGVNASRLGELASAVQAGVVTRGAASEALMAARHAISPLATEYDTKLWAWVRERQVASLHAWACMLGLELRLHAHASADAFLGASAPLSAQMVLGLDLDPASTDDLRRVVSQSLASDGFVVAGIQQTESSDSTSPVHGTADAHADAHAAAHAAPHAASASAAAFLPPTPPPPPPPHAHSGHDHSGLKGNAYNFGSSPQHAASFDLTQGQLSDIACTRTDAGQPLGCVEAAYNWFATLCTLGPHLGRSAALTNAFVEWTAGWPLGVRAAERCAGQRHFLGWEATDDEAAAEPTAARNPRNQYLLRGLMGFCMFHGCKEVAPLVELDLASYGMAATPQGSVLFL